LTADSKQGQRAMASDIRQILQQATAAFEAGSYKEAEGLLLQVMSQTSTYANVYNMLGFIAGERNAPEKAVAFFRRALSLNPNYTEARLNLVLTLTEMGLYDQAAVEASRLEMPEPTGSHRLSLGVRGKLANTHADLGRKYHELGLYTEAIGEFDKALRLCPTFPDIYNRRAVSYRELGQYAESRASLLKALELKPTYAEAHVNLGVLHQKLGNLPEAVKSWERALQLDPKHRLARIYLKQATAQGFAAR
jgi:tetratricopeptide (TPR) repeat protein